MNSLLRKTIRQILREAAGAGKIDELVGKIQEINNGISEYYAGEDLRGKELPRLGIMIEDRGEEADIAFAILGITYSGVLTPDRVSSLSSKGSSQKLGDLLDVELPWGRIEIGSIDGPKCSGAWNVIVTLETKPGWGPLLYDVAIEVATEKAGGLTSDRGEVSDEALRVWTAYDKSRGDVEKAQLDLTDTDISRWGGADPNLVHLTPETEDDDCYQYSAFDERIAAGDLNSNTRSNWVKSPLSRVYRKPPVTKAKLESIGSLFAD